MGHGEGVKHNPTMRNDIVPYPLVEGLGSLIINGLLGVGDVRRMDAGEDEMSPPLGPSRCHHSIALGSPRTAGSDGVLPIPIP